MINWENFNINPPELIAINEDQAGKLMITRNNPLIVGHLGAPAEPDLNF